MKVAVYCRVSTDEQDNDKQEYIINEYCSRMGLEIKKVYKDVISGMKDNRPAFNELIADMRNYEFDGIIVTKIDRLGRSLSHLLSLFNEFERRGVGFIAVTQNIDTKSAAGRLQLHLLSAFAEFERNLISERTKEGIRRAQGVGKRGKDKKKRSNEGYLARYRKGGENNPLFSGELKSRK